ncbi:electron transfer flavoprotein alpha-subunit [Diplodia corticola]|uniref:Electron transfer flavoprotein alpha-subunit n=1 Tax=Diplodia corticola TaxID=236234 RepID=A0A1J9RLD0_9PEZI|nr:electron transfer flavoprotein alpha-subunit [Diplodia corticola]OJD29319.1 electron transfer flavoprotein alpha-subunit [Diplodia corticola]
MAKSSDAVAPKSESASPYQLDSAQALRAAKALTAHIKSSESTKTAASTKKNLLEDESSEDGDVAADGQVPVWLIVTTKKHIVDKKRLKPTKIALPHPLPAPGQRICLITADPQRSYKDLIEESAFPQELRERIGRVIGISKLKAKYKTYEAKRQLYAEYDIFLADDRIITFLPSALGKVFYKTTAKRPVPVHLMGNEKVQKDAEGKKAKKSGEDKSSSIVGAPAAVAKDMQKALDSALVHLSPSATTAIRIANASFEPKQITENLKAVVQALTTQEKLIPKGWRNIRSLHIKGPETTALPVWLADELWVEEQDVLDEKHKPVDKSERLKIKEDEQNKKRKPLEDAKEESTEKPAKKSKKEKVQGADLSKEIAQRKETLRKQKKAAKADA